MGKFPLSKLLYTSFTEMLQSEDITAALLLQSHQNASSLLFRSSVGRHLKKEGPCRPLKPSATRDLISQDQRFKATILIS